MEGILSFGIWGQICGVHFPKENFKCFQLLPVDSNGQIISNIIEKVREVQPKDINERSLISIRNILQIDHSKLENWTLIKSLFRTNMASCMWMQDPGKIEAKVEYNLEEHTESYSIKLKYELLINLRDKLENYQKLVNEVAWHKMICWFNTGSTGTLDKYLNECLSELTEMKQEQVLKGVSLYELVMKDKDGMERVALHRHESHKEYLTKYERYGDIIGSALEMAYQRSKLIKKMEEKQICIKTSDEDKIVTLDYGSVRYLASYLNDSDIKNFIKFFE